MTDDIVTRLREVHRPTVMQAYPSALCVEAADEIERLRKILRHVASNNPMWADPEMECRTCNDLIMEFGK